MKRTKRQSLGVRISLGFFLAFLFAMILGGFGITFHFEFAWHLLTGGPRFLIENLNRGVLDQSLLWSFLFGLLLGGALLHGSGKWLAGSFAKAWGAKQTVLCLAAVCVMFAGSFLVPGVLMLLRTPMTQPIVEATSGRGIEVELNYFRTEALKLGESSQKRLLPSREEFDQELAEQGYQGHEYFYYLLPGEPLEGPHFQAIFASPLIQGRHFVIFREGEVVEFKERDFERLIREQAR